MSKLVILDFCTGDVDIYEEHFEYIPDTDDLLKKLGHRPKNCQYMFTDGTIKFHKETLNDDFIKE